MSLISEIFEDFTMLDRTTTDDNEGSFVESYTEGAHIKAAVSLDASMEARVAEASGVKNIYTIITPRAVNLQFHNVLRRDRDGKVFLVTSDGDDRKTPASASLNMRAVSAQEWRLPS